MKKIIFILMLIPGIIIAQNGNKNFIDQNYIEVNGNSEMEIVPDQIYMQIILNEKDNKGKTSIKDIENAMFDTLKNLGINLSQDLAVKDMSSNLKQRLLSKNDVLLSKEYQLLVHTGNMAGQVMLELEKLGISNVNIDHVDHSQIEKFRREVKADAMKAAKAKAESLAGAIGQTIGRAIYIQELNNNYRAPMTANSIMIRGASSLSQIGSKLEPEINFEKIKLEYSILCRFELK